MVKPPLEGSCSTLSEVLCQKTHVAIENYLQGQLSPASPDIVADLQI